MPAHHSEASPSFNSAPFPTSLSLAPPASPTTSGFAPPTLPPIVAVAVCESCGSEAVAAPIATVLSDCASAAEPEWAPVSVVSVAPSCRLLAAPPSADMHARVRFGMSCTHTYTRKNSQTRAYTDAQMPQRCTLNFSGLVYQISILCLSPLLDPLSWV